MWCCTCYHSIVTYTVGIHSTLLLHWATSSSKCKFLDVIISCIDSHESRSSWSLAEDVHVRSYGEIHLRLTVGDSLRASRIPARRCPHGISIGPHTFWRVETLPWVPLVKPQLWKLLPERSFDKIKLSNCRKHEETAFLNKLACRVIKTMSHRNRRVKSGILTTKGNFWVLPKCFQPNMKNLAGP